MDYFLSGLLYQGYLLGLMELISNLQSNEIAFISPFFSPAFIFSLHYQYFSLAALFNSLHLSFNFWNSISFWSSLLKLGIFLYFSIPVFNTTAGFSGKLSRSCRVYFFVLFCIVKWCIKSWIPGFSVLSYPFTSVWTLPECQTHAFDHKNNTQSLPPWDSFPFRVLEGGKHLTMSNFKGN